MSQEDSYILWLPSWYPNKLALYDGDFIQRHAQAASLYDPIYVVKIVADESGVITKDVKVEINQQNNLTEQIIYYKKPASIFSRLLSGYKGMRLYRRAIKKCISQIGKPRLVHVHVGMRAGLVALWLKRYYGIQFILTEHWAGFCPEAKRNFDSLPSYLKVFWKRVVKKAVAISTVSAYLGEVLKKQFAISNYIVIPNVVNTETFYYIERINLPPPQFIHISGLDYQKNPQDILKAFSIVKNSGNNFHLDVFGPIKNDLQEMANDLQLREQVSFHGEVPQAELAKFVRQSEALILYSRYESFGCVVIEANACGIPVVVSDLPVFHENVKQGVNGLFVKGEDPESLSSILSDLIKRKYHFDNTTISSMTFDKYSYRIVGERFHEWYIDVIETIEKL